MGLKKEELHVQFNKLVSAADEGSEEAVKSMLKVLLSSIEISMKNNPDKDDSKIIEEHNIPIEECSKQVKQEKEEVKKLCEIKVCLVRSKKLKNLDNIDDYIKTLKKFLVSVLEVSKSNIELRNELSNLEEKSNELRDKLRSGGECFKKILNNKESLEEIVKIIKSFQKKKEEEVKNKLVSFQKAKESFLYCLGETINELNKCCQELKTHTKEYAVRDEIIKGIRGMGEAFDSPIKIVNPIKLAVEIASVFNNCCKMSFCDKRSDEFKNYLQGEELNTFLFSETYNSLIEVIQENKGLDIKISLHVTKILDLEEGLREYKKLKTFNNRYEKEIIKNQPEIVNEKDQGGNSLLHYDTIEDNTEVIGLLLSKGADIEAKNYFSATPLQIATLKVNLSLVKFLIEKGARLEVFDTNNNLLFDSSSGEGREMIKYLLDNCISISLPISFISEDNSSKSALLFSKNIFSQSAYEKMMEIETISEEEREELFEAVEEGDVKLVRKIISSVKERNIDINSIRNESDGTLLHYAAGEGNLEMLKFLIEEGCDINASDKYG
ncbi:10862_t:CDS:2 [Paraglomus occultum]|uniref:10862_t:CDS:1 n=1 Tax=Paraglomus occultum TaxID=144539 RepID=A0A9N9AVZ7_9GLOM|nr:10862_t:CDS:2 [Paraglomus occultum]